MACTCTTNERPIFDDIADHYDETRGAARHEEIDAISSILNGCRTLLDIGVGTGRIAKPLQDRGFFVTGVDLSIKMMERAKDKGIENLVIGDARKLPFLDKSFDASISVHVFHLVNDRRHMMLEAARVSRKYIMSLVNESSHEGQEGNGRRSKIWEIYLETRAEFGFPLEPSRRLPKRFRESSIAEEFKPFKKLLVGNFKRNFSTHDPAERFGKSSRYVELSRDIPEKVNSKILDKVQERIAGMKHTVADSLITEYLYVWRPKDILNQF